jgi:hypothetical protein
VIIFFKTFFQVRVLATLDHPNIISYYDSFEREGILMIGIKKKALKLALFWCCDITMDFATAASQNGAE